MGERWDWARTRMREQLIAYFREYAPLPVACLCRRQHALDSNSASANDYGGYLPRAPAIVSAASSFVIAGALRRASREDPHQSCSAPPHERRACAAPGASGHAAPGLHTKTTEDRRGPQRE